MDSDRDSTRRGGSPRPGHCGGGRGWLVVTAGALCASAVLGACSSTPSPHATASTATTARGEPGSAGAGCGGSPAGSTTLTQEIGGHRRTVIVHVPSGYRGTTPVPLVLNMHGSSSIAVAQEAFTGMNATADVHGFVVAYPQGAITEGSGYDWNVPGVPLVGGRAVPAGSPDDVAFLTTLVSVLEHRYCIDPARVYATGFSGGARITSQLACDASGVFAAVAPVSGLRHPTPCATTRPVPVVAFHGTADPVDPYTGHGEAYWTYSVPTAAQDWAHQNGCAPSPQTSRPAAGSARTTYGRCRQGATVELYTLVGEGHDWPGGPPLARSITRVLGPQSSAVDANEVMWAFFAAHPMPRAG